MSQTPQPPLGGRYELRRQLATTPAARVYLAQDLELGRPVAIKVLGPELARDPQIVAKFRQAANAAAAVHDPRIVAIYDWGEDQGAVYVAMEYVEGASLAETLSTTGRLGVAPTINMGVRVAESLDAAHRAGLVHGSLKPRDVLLGRDGTVKVADYGTATAGLAALAGPVSTATYDAPEQLQGQPPDNRSDLYALGVVLYEAITGAPPFTGPDAGAITQRKLTERVLPPSVAMPSIPPGFDAIIDRLLERDPQRRYASGGDVAADLIRLGETAQIPLVDPTMALPTVAARPAAVVPPAATPPPEEKKKSATGWIIAAIIVVLLIIGGLAAYALTRDDDDGAQVEVPSVIGSRAAEASAVLSEQGLSPSTQNEANDDFGEGIVFEQAPVAGTQARKGSVVVIKVSTGPTTTSTSSTSSTSTSTAPTTTTTTSTTTTTTTTTTAPPPPST